MGRTRSEGYFEKYLRSPDPVPEWVRVLQINHYAPIILREQTERDRKSLPGAPHCQRIKEGILLRKFITPSRGLDESLVRRGLKRDRKEFGRF